MGIKHFYTWFRSTIPQAILPSNNSTHIDHLLIDMNGVIHEAAQCVHQYGEYEHVRRIGKMIPPSPSRLYDEIKKRVNIILDVCQPRKSIYLAIDGVAPKSKQNQQRQRRFRAAAERKSGKFESNNITAGTTFMSALSDNLADLRWARKRGASIQLSTDGHPGEGEHKLINKIRKSDRVDDSFCVVGLDADLILLSMLLEKRRIYIYRGYQMIDVDAARRALPIPVKDFAVLCCLVGNDFLPPISSLEIKTGALELFFRYYATPLVGDGGKLKLEAIGELLGNIDENTLLMNKLTDETRFPDDIWNRSDGDVELYKNNCTNDHFNTPMKKVVYNYIKTLQWIYYYYTKGIPSWHWYYPHNYAPFISDLINNIPRNVVSFKFQLGTPSTKEEQLLRVIPPTNGHILPEHLREFHSTLPRQFTIDRSGKHHDWEAIVIVDFVEL